MEVEERLERFLSREPVIAESAYVAPSAVVMGAVTLAEDSSVWPGAILRGDIEEIRVGRGSNIQDGTIVHLADDMPVEIGEYVTIGHGAMIHACKIGDACLIGMRAIVLDGAQIGAESIVGAGALVTKGTVVPPGSLVMGMPAKVVKSLDENTRKSLRCWAEKYVKVSRAHKKRDFGSAD